MKTAGSSRTQADDETTGALKVEDRVRYIETTVEGGRGTGITILDPSGTKGTFHPDEEPTGLSEDMTGRTSVKDDVTHAPTPGLRDLYPHWDEGHAEAGIAIRLISQAIADLEQATELSKEQTPLFYNHLVLAENQLFQAAEKSRFNKAFELVISFCAWAVKNASLADPSTGNLQAMLSALRELRDSPFVGTDRAADLMAGLENNGWNGQSIVGRLFEDGLELFEQKATSAENAGPLA